MQAGVRLLENGYHFIKAVNVPRIQNGGWLELQQQGELGLPLVHQAEGVEMSAGQNCQIAQGGRISILRQQHPQEVNFLEETEAKHGWMD